MLKPETIRTSWVKMKPFAEWPQDHRGALDAQLKENPDQFRLEDFQWAEIICKPLSLRPLAGLSCSPLFRVVSSRDSKGCVRQAFGVLCPHIAEIGD